MFKDTEMVPKTGKIYRLSVLYDLSFYKIYNMYLQGKKVWKDHTEHRKLLQGTFTF